MLGGLSRRINVISLIAPPPLRLGPPRRTPRPLYLPLGTACTRKPSLASWTLPRTGDVSLHTEMPIMLAHEFQLVHTLASIPVHEGFAPVHGRELLADTLEQGLDTGTISWSLPRPFVRGGSRGGVADEGRGHLEPARGDIAIE